ncbi:MAG: hypothetical protein ACK5MV_00200 [Aminipila sp.]
MDFKLLWHVSFEPITQFELRVPAFRVEGEDNVTPRICMAENILDCLNAMPGGGYAVRGLMCLPPEERILYAYASCENPKNLIEPKELEEKYGVLDALVTKEHWLLEVPGDIKEIPMLVTGATTHKAVDSLGNKGVVVDTIDYDVSKVIKHSMMEHLEKRLPEIFATYDWREILAGLGGGTD